MSKFIVFNSLDEMPELPVSQANMSWNRTGSWRSSTPGHRGKTAPCNFNCPAGEDIRGYLALMKKGNVAQAFTLLTSKNPLPAVCGRVCYHPCQAQCNRHSFDTELNVRAVEKLIGDWGIENKQRLSLPDTESKRVAVVGAGPAGLAAAHFLRRKGVAVTMYDENEYPGGILYYGIPAYRLEKDILQAELARVIDGIKYKANMRLGSGLDFGTLDEYDAIFIATGAHLSKRMRIDGEELPGVESGLDFLKKTNSGQKVDLDGKQVMVIGGGNTACDVARSAYRLGASVTVAYRRTEAEMPAFSEEVEQLKSEAIDLELLVAPARIEKDSGGRLMVTCHRMELGEPDVDGRRRPVVIDDADFTMTVDVVFAAIGEDPDLGVTPGLAYSSNGTVDLSQVEPRIRDKLFLGGDILPNPRTVPHAVASGRIGANQMVAFLRGESYQQPEKLAQVAGPDDVNFNYFTRIRTIKGTATPAHDVTFDETEAIEEANRCLSCGVCFECDNCYNFCPDLAVVRTPGGYKANLDYCKGCGICARECPSGSMGMHRGRVS